MGCFDGDDRVYADNVGFRKSNRPRRCTDMFCLLIFFLFWAGLIFIASFAFFVGSPLRLIYGSDSFGNTCGQRNDQMDQLTFSGLDMSDKPFVFYLNARDISKSMRICVKQCPNETLMDAGAMSIYYQKTGNSLCRYDLDLGVVNYGYGNSFSGLTGNNNQINVLRLMQRDEDNGVGPCPKFPVYAS